MSSREELVAQTCLTCQDGVGDTCPRWVSGEGRVCYQSAPATQVDRALYEKWRRDALLGAMVEELEVPACGGRAWEMRRGDVCRISLPAGPQVADLNLWNLQDSTEHFYAGKTRQLHAAHLSCWDRLWSCLPHLRPMATIVRDSLHGYGHDQEGAGVHDVIGTRCDPYTWKLIQGASWLGGPTCHSNLVRAVSSHGLTESHVHDVLNVFMCTGLTREGRYFVKPTPARRGDFLELLADMDLLLALSSCPQGDVSSPVGQQVPPELCHPVRVQVFRAE